ncbi:MAG TPA: hypothetical protein VEY30_00230, partial [Myxococcaceae bacterium]|nr:hypothetical protein [Myxococcaceae bacterium]
MIYTWLLAATLSAPRAPPVADASLYIPSASAAERLWSFFEEAGKHASLLRPSSWRPELHPLFGLELAPASSLSTWGVDPNGALTFSALGEGRQACTDLESPERFEGRVRERLAQAGEPWEKSARGASIRGVREGGKLLAGYAIKGRQACAFADPVDAEAISRRATDSVSRTSQVGLWTRLTSLPGAAYLVFARGALGLNAAAADALAVQGLFPSAPLPPLQAGGQSPYAAMEADGLLFARAQVTPGGVAGFLRQLTAELTRVCPSCSADLQSLAREVGPALTGRMVLRVNDVDLRGPLNSPAARFFAVRHAAAAELKDVARVSQALETMAKTAAGGKTADGFSFPLSGAKGGRPLLLRLRGRHLLVGNDAEALAALAGALADRSAEATHGADFRVDPQAVARALGRVSLMDLLTTPELAAVAAA